MGIGNRRVPSVRGIGIIRDHTLLIHSHEHQNLTNHFKLHVIALERDFGRIKGHLWH